jgi:hypothetical protein
MATPPAPTDQPSTGRSFRRATRFEVVLLLAIVLGLAIAFSLVSGQFFMPPGQPIIEASAVPSFVAPASVP